MTNAAYWIEGPWSGKLAILARPRGGEWLEDDIRQWERLNIHGVVSLLTKRESTELGLMEEATLVDQQELQFFTLPIVDRGTPSSFQNMRDLVETVSALLLAGKNIGVHCRQGVGRSALLAASLLVHTGIDADIAFARIESARGCQVPDTAEQRQWVKRFAAQEALPVF